MKQIVIKLKTAAVAAMVGLAALPATLPAASLPAGPHLVTSGAASVDTSADIAVLVIEINSIDNDVAKAKQKADARVAEYLTFLQQHAVAKQDINAASLRTQPEYEYQKSGAMSRKGYRATRQVHVTVRALTKLNQVLDSALQLGLNDIRTLELAVAEPAVYQEQVRLRAIADATQRAHSLAAGFGVKLGPLFSIRYQVASQPAPPAARMYKTANAAISSAETYQQQTIRFDDAVEVVFELQR